MRLLVARLGWSSFNWQGLPTEFNEQTVKLYSKDVNEATMNYIRKNGYGHEWWNFDDNFCKHFKLTTGKCDEAYYYGTIPRSVNGMRRKLREALEEKDEELMIFFISRDPTTLQMKLVGIYCHAKH